MRLLATVLAATVAFISLSSAFAASNLPPNFDPIAWAKLVREAVAKGERYEMSDGMELRALTRLSPANLSGPHKADYFSTLGGFDENGKYVPFEISVVSENWTINADNNWDIEQRTYRVGVRGDLYQLTHSHIVETMDRFIVSLDNYAVGAPDSPEELATWGQKFDEWKAALLRNFH